MILWILRAIFILLSLGLTFSVARIETKGETGAYVLRDVMIVVIPLISLATVCIDAFTKRKRIELISCVYFGIFIGLLLAYAVGAALDNALLADIQPAPELMGHLRLVLAVIFSYVCISILLQTKDDFRFIIPYVEFSREIKGAKPYILDTSVVIDGRIADLVDTNLFDSTLIMPRFALAELQAIADSSDKMKRSRGRRGLDILEKLRGHESVDFSIYDRELPEFEKQSVDMKLVLLAKHLNGKVITGDYNLNKVARLHTVPVVNLNDIANALKPVFLPGEFFDVQIVKAGEGQTQGVGYLEDGTMIVIEGGRDHIHETVRVSVTSVLQKSAGRMIFGKFENVVSQTKR